MQGVGFRFFTEEAARREGLTGWVKNCADGSVEAYAEGDRDAMDRFEHRLRRGPSRSRVDKVNVIDEAPTGRWRGFSTEG